MLGQGFAALPELHAVFERNAAGFKLVEHSSQLIASLLVTQLCDVILFLGNDFLSLIVCGCFELALSEANLECLFWFNLRRDTDYMPRSVTNHGIAPI